MSFKTEAQALSPRALWLPGEVSGGTVTDESGNGFDATNNGGVASGSGGPGSGLTSYMAFDGTDDYLACTTLGDFGSTSIKTMTAGIWLRDPVGIGTIYGSVNNGTTTALLCSLNTDDGSTLTNGQVLLYSRDETGTTNDVEGWLSSPESELVDGDWHFLVIRYDVGANPPTYSVRFDKTELSITYGERDDLAQQTADFDHPLALAARNARGTITVFQEVDVAGFVLFDTNLTDQEADDLYDAATGTGANIPVGQAVEAETGQPITPLISRDVAVGQTTEAETAQPITPALVRQVTVNPATEAETANPITPLINRNVTIGQAVETETANPITPSLDRQVTLGQASESETAGTINPVGANEVTVTRAAETETAQPIIPATDREVVVGQASEVETAGSFTPVIGRLVPIGTATEAETGNALTPVVGQRVLIGQAAEVELARAISPDKPIFVPLQTAVERELARVITPSKDVPGRLGPAVCEVVSPSVECEVYAL